MIVGKRGFRRYRLPLFAGRINRFGERLAISSRAFTSPTKAAFTGVGTPTLSPKRTKNPLMASISVPEFSAVSRRDMSDAMEDVFRAVVVRT